MKTFVRLSHNYPEVGFVGLCIMLLSITAVGFFNGSCSLQQTETEVIATIAFTILGMYLTSKSGLYVQDNSLYFRILRSKKIDPSEIIWIRKAPAFMRGGKYLRDRPIKDEEGNQLYSMLLMSDCVSLRLHPECWNDFDGYPRNDLSLRDGYGEYVLAYAKYDQSVIDHLLTLNPNIIVF